jgi:hypothetical protein
VGAEIATDSGQVAPSAIPQHQPRLSWKARMWAPLAIQHLPKLLTMAAATSPATLQRLEAICDRGWLDTTESHSVPLKRYAVGSHWYMKTACQTNNLIRIVRLIAEPHEKSEVNLRSDLVTCFSFANQAQNCQRVVVIDRILPGHNSTTDAIGATQLSRTGNREVMWT